LRIKAKIMLEYESEKRAKAIVKAVSPDNVKYPGGLSVKTFSENSKVVNLITCEGKIGTFIMTVDDLLRCITVAEKTSSLIESFE